VFPQFASSKSRSTDPDAKYIRNQANLSNSISAFKNCISGPHSSADVSTLATFLESIIPELYENENRYRAEVLLNASELTPNPPATEILNLSLFMIWNNWPGFTGFLGFNHHAIDQLKCFITAFLSRCSFTDIPLPAENLAITDKELSLPTERLFLLVIDRALDGDSNAINGLC